jgi:hypothetical protein
VNLGDLEITWSNRSRTEQETMIAFDDASEFTQEGTFDIEVLLDGVKVREWTSVTGNSQTYTWAQRISDDPRLLLDVQFRFTPIGTAGEEGMKLTTPPIRMDPT